MGAPVALLGARKLFRMKRANKALAAKLKLKTPGTINEGEKAQTTDQPKTAPVPEKPKTFPFTPGTIAGNAKPIQDPHVVKPVLPLPKKKKVKKPGAQYKNGVLQPSTGTLLGAGLG